MKGLTKIMMVVAVVAVPFLLYVHGKVGLFRVSYDLDRQARELAEKTEDYRRLKFEVQQLKAPHLLEQRAKELRLSLAFPKDVRVVRVAVPQTLPVLMESEVSQQAPTTHFLQFFERWIGVAQARTEE